MNALTDKLNTNFFIYHIYQIINNKPNSINPKLLFNNNNKLYDIPNIKDAGNPLTYYESILKYLNYDTLKFMKQTFTSKSNVEETITKSFKVYQILYLILLLSKIFKVILYTKPHIN